MSAEGEDWRAIVEDLEATIADLERQLLDKSQIMGAQQAELDLHHAGQYCPSCNPCRRAPEITDLEQKIAELESQVSVHVDLNHQQAKQLAEAQKDAERYRYLKERHVHYASNLDTMQWAKMDWCVDVASLAPSTLDEAIDAAIDREGVRDET